VDIKKDNGVITIDEVWRIEAGPARKTAAATAELLADDVTASHYKAGGKDALGKAIELGKPMTYIDWRSQERVFYVYRLVTIKKGGTDPATGQKSAVDHGRFMPAGTAPDEMAAISLVTELAAKEAAAAKAPAKAGS
jgi:hypothetical protein